MRLSVDGVELASVTPMEWRALMDGYRQSEQAAGRSVPEYAFDALAAVLGLWLLKKLGDEVWKRTVEYRGKRAAKAAAAGQRATEALRHEQVLARLEALAPAARPPADGLGELLRAAAENNMRIVITLENDTERDLGTAIRKALPQAQVEGA